MSAASFRSDAATDPGHVRRRNEDAVFANDKSGAYFVVDGMGGQNAGDVAARIACETLQARLERRTSTPERRIREAIALANNAIFERSLTKPEWRGMGCVLTVALIEEGVLHFGHVGDTRLYKLRNGEIRKITADHSPVGELEDSSQISEREAMQHPRRNEVFRDVGSERRDPDDAFFIEYGVEELENDAAVLLCSDGLSDVVPQAKIRSIIDTARGDPRRVTGLLIDAANEEGKDNVSAVYIEGPGFAPSYRGDDTQKNPPARVNLLAVIVSILLASTLAFAVGWIAGSWKPAATQPRVWQVAPGEIPSIAQALEQATAGDTIQVAPGDYREQLHLKEGVRIIGNQAALLAPLASTTPVVDAEGLAYAKLEGFSIPSEGPYDTAVRIHDSNVELERLHVSGARKAAVTFSGNSKGRVYASRFQGNAIAIAVTDEAAPHIDHNVFHANKTAIEWRSSAPRTENSNALVKEFVKQEERRP